MWHYIHIARDFTTRSVQNPFYTVQMFPEYRLPQKPQLLKICQMWTTLKTKKDINLTQVLWLLLDLPLVLDSLSLLHQRLVRSKVSKPVASFPPRQDIRHDSLQEIPFYSTSMEITMFKEASQELMSWSNTSNPNLPSYFITMDICITIKPVCGSTMTRIYIGISGVQILAASTELSLLQNIQTSSSAHPASNSTETRDLLWQ